MVRLYLNFRNVSESRQFMRKLVSHTYFPVKIEYDTLTDKMLLVFSEEKYMKPFEDLAKEIGTPYEIVNED